MRLVIIDGNAILHRAFHALPPLTTTKGELINAVYGFTSMLIRVKNELNPGYLIVCFDRPKPTFRQKVFVGYQAKRPKMDEELAGQIEKVHEVVKVLNIPIYEMDGYEADDVIGTIATKAIKLITNNKKLKTEKNETVIVTGDRDILQLVNENTRVYMPTKGLSEAKLYGEKEVEEKFGIKANQMVDYKALVGDNSDNYGGVNGVGPKTAAGLLQKYKTLKGIYQNLDKLPANLAEKLKSGKSSADLAQELARIITDVPIKIDFEKAKEDDIVSEEVVALFEKFEFHSLLKRLPGYQSNEPEKPAKKKKNEVSKDQLGLF